MKWLIMFALLIGAVAVYWAYIRPQLKLDPLWRPMFAAEDSIVARVKAWFLSSKTINYGNIQIALATLMQLVESLRVLDWAAVWPQWAPVILFAMGLITILLRMLTTESVSDKKT